MAIERDLELLDDYLANRLSGGEKEAFERKLESDPTLKSEYQLQQKLIEGIKSARVAELKTMLNNTPVPSPGGQHLFTKIATWTVVTGVVVTGAYFLFSKQDVQTPEPQQQAIVENKKPAETSESAVQPSTSVIEQKETAANEAKQTDATVEKKAGKKATVKSPDKTTDNAISKKPEVFYPGSEVEGDANARPEQPEAQVTPEVTENMEVKAVQTQATAITNDKKHTFDYQFKNGRVLLYGPFERDLYEIMEFISDTKRTSFLYYKDNYYLLNDSGDEKIKQLVPINDPVLLNKLKELRSKSK
jgi:hypothetical protein